jgi:hypothetical protein
MLGKLMQGTIVHVRTHGKKDTLVTLRNDSGNGEEKATHPVLVPHRLTRRGPELRPGSLVAVEVVFEPLRLCTDPHPVFVYLLRAHRLRVEVSAVGPAAVPAQAPKAPEPEPAGDPAPKAPPVRKAPPGPSPREAPPGPRKAAHRGNGKGNGRPPSPRPRASRNGKPSAAQGPALDAPPPLALAEGFPSPPLRG